MLCYALNSRHAMLRATKKKIVHDIVQNWVKKTVNVCREKNKKSMTNRRNGYGCIIMENKLVRYRITNTELFLSCDGRTQKRLH